MIPEKVLKDFGAKISTYAKGDLIYEENESSEIFYQIKKGSVKLNNFNESSQEFIQNVIEEGEAFGQAVLFIDETYPTNAFALSDCEILELSKDQFFRLLQQFPEYSVEINKELSRRLYYKMMMAKNMASNHPSAKVLALLDYFKKTRQIPAEKPYQVPLTRQQIANLTGLRVETVIRVIKNFEKEGRLKIIQRKIFY